MGAPFLEQLKPLLDRATRTALCGVAPASAWSDSKNIARNRKNADAWTDAFAVNLCKASGMSVSSPPRLTASKPFYIDISATNIVADAASYVEPFRAIPALLFEDVLSPLLLEQLMKRAASSGFDLRDNGHVGLRQFADDGSIGAAFALMLDRSMLRRWLEQATGCPPLRGVVGSINQASPDTDDGLEWHDDLTNKGRTLGIVINLSENPYEGGVFEMRPKGTTKPILTCHHLLPGSTLIFAVRPNLEHRVTAVTTGGPRRVYTGWFLRDDTITASSRE